MNTQYKYLIWAGTASLVMLTAYLFVAVGHLSETAATANTISFNGEGRILTKPDIAAVSFSIVTEAKTSKSAQDSNSEKSKKIVAFLDSQDIDDKDIKTTGYNVYPQYSNYLRPCPLDSIEMMSPNNSSGTSTYPCTDNTQKITGYQVNQSFEVKVHDLEKVSTILDGLVTAGANQVNNLGFRVDNIEKVKDEARLKAIEDAKVKANDLKKQLGIRLGKIVNYYENQGGYPIYYETKMMDAGRGGAASSGPEVPAGENEIVVNVTITYQIK